MVKKIKKGFFALALALPLFALISAAKTINFPSTNTQKLTSETAQKIANGTIKLEGGFYDSLLLNQPILDPEADDDGDGIKNKDEIFTYFRDGTEYYGLNSHPRMQDTDGDGIIDSQDQNKLEWDLSPRDMLFFQELAYRETKTIFSMFNDDNFLDFKNDVQATLNLAEPGKYSNEKYMLNSYVNMQYELARFWKPVYIYDGPNGYNAIWFTNQSDFPWLKNQTLNVLAIRGTKGGGDLGADGKIFFGTRPAQLYENVNQASWYWQSWNLRNPKNVKNFKPENFNTKQLDWLNTQNVVKFAVTGHSLGGYLANGLAGYLKINKKDGAKSTNFLGSWTFNAPKNKDSEFEKAINEWIDAKMSHNYRTEGDSMGTWVGWFKNVEVVGPGGHSNAEFFKKDIVAKKFTNGIRKAAEVVENPQPQLLNLASTNKILNVRYIKRFSGNVVAEFANVFTNQKRFADKIKKGLPAGYSFVYPDRINNLSLDSHDVEINLDYHNLIYNFKLNGKIINTQQFGINVENVEAPVPTIPTNSNIRKKYVLKNLESIPVVTDFTKSATFNIDLEEVDNKADTTINFIDSATGQKLETTITKNTYLDENITFDSQWLNGDYKLTNPNTTITVGQVNNIEVTPINFIQNFNYFLNGKVVDRKTHASLKSQALTTPELPKNPNLHKGYRITSNTITNQTEEAQSWDVVLEEFELPKVNTTFNFTYNSEIISTQVINDWSDVLITKDRLVIPTHYLANSLEANYEANNTYTIELSKEQYTLTYKFMFGDSLVKSVDIVVPYNEEYTLPSVPTSNSNDFEYSLVNALEKVRNVDRSQTITVQLQKDTVTTVINFVYKNETIETAQIVKAPSYTVTMSDVHLPQGYMLENPGQTNITTGSENNIEVNLINRTSTFTLKEGDEVISTTKVTKRFDRKISASEIDIPNGFVLENTNQDFTPGENYDLSLIRNKYTLTYNFIYQNQVIKTETITVPYHKDYVVPTIPNSNSDDFVFEAQNSSNLEKIALVERDETINVDLVKKQTNTVIKYYDTNHLLIKTQTITKSPLYVVTQNDLVLPKNYILNSQVNITTGQVNEITLNKEKLRSLIKYFYKGFELANQLVVKDFDAFIHESDLILPTGYVLANKNHLSLKNGVEHTIELERQSFTVTYSFYDQEEKVGIETINVLYDESYALPPIPTSKNPDYDYVLHSDYKAVKHVTENLHFDVQLVRAVINTTVNYYFNNTLISTQTFTKAPSHEITISDLTVPSGYALVNKKAVIQKGDVNDLQLTDNVIQTKFIFINNNQEIDSITISQSDNSVIELGEITLPKGYRVSSSASKREFTPGSTYKVEVEKKTFEVVYKFVFENNVVAKEIVSVPYLESVPSVEIPDSGTNSFKYKLQGSWPSVNSVEDDQEVVINLVKDQVTTKINYFYEGQKISSQNFISYSGYPINKNDLLIPIYFELENENVMLQTGTENNLVLVPQKIKTTFVFRDKNQDVATQVVLIPFNGEISIQDINIPNGYVLNQETPTTFAPSEEYVLEVSKKQFTLKYRFIFNNKIIQENDVQVLYHESYQVPTFKETGNLVAPKNITVIENVENDQVIDVVLQDKNELDNKGYSMARWKVFLITISALIAPIGAIFLALKFIFKIW
ncbi:lipase family protein [Mycoplasmopsis gallinacea]|uniref:Fungal lipase-type domain-containing protein n=1 Tax=Mycoplasmopsis gallinacea TaxID=29556 RepID=A0A6H0V4H6_9BACT|nr:lipase family protein [Mycoplasmopsis gallinacea]QIW62634.1 hypothetical protein GOQ20_04470 [Mycoplasmopsis gallinacea]